MEVWLVELENCAAALEAEEARKPRLADDDLERIAALADPLMRRQRRLATIALRGRIAWFARSDRYDGVAFVRQPGGKPLLADTSLAFNVSHAGGRALIALGRVGALGVDLEPERTLRMSADRQRALVRAAADVSSALARDDRLTASEAEPLADASGVAGDLPSAHGVLRAWVRLEAVAKAQGGGIGRLLTATGVLGARQRRPAQDGPPKSALSGLDGLAVRDLVVPARHDYATASAHWFAAIAADAAALVRVPPVRLLSAATIVAAR